MIYGPVYFRENNEGKKNQVLKKGEREKKNIKEKKNCKLLFPPHIFPGSFVVVVMARGEKNLIS